MFTRLGQHFLVCPWVAERMRDAAKITSEDTVLEIGPGRGALTRVLAHTGARVIAIEKDEALARELHATLTRKTIQNVSVLTGDIRDFLTREKKTDFALLFGNQPYKVVANIPYYLSSRLIRLLLTISPKPSTLALTLQKEVAERMVAVVPRMNLLALSVQIYGIPHIIASVPASCFNPRPKIDSMIVIIEHINNNFFIENKISEEIFFAFVRHAFSTKRKFITHALRSYASLHNNEAQQLLTQFSIPQNARPETLTLSQWTLLIRALNSRS
ncbi:MAG: 16S rRNA (adenine1518-N6/adenine1519-N6)-dimethyltransferase [Parcubacteria group bacterium Gr01-1014_66]|nr:MAG: 16S rRNA (adenine1518-N6/adenine1519-N6)-dimethyltransferase [Parcubacteria group bacterium Gr01-1014_66]